MQLEFTIANEADAAAIAQLATATDRHLLDTFGRDSSKSLVTEKAILLSLKTPHVLMARQGSQIVGSLSLKKKKPWAIDPAYFTAVRTALYITNMAVAPECQRQGVGRSLLNYARIIALSWPADPIRLDAYDSEIGAGGFYAKCGYREVGRVVYRRTPLIYFEQMV
jgi:ribosomal protein S18 acetylase RimI-like enzyme